MCGPYSVSAGRSVQVDQVALRVARAMALHIGGPEADLVGAARELRGPSTPASLRTDGCELWPAAARAASQLGAEQVAAAPVDPARHRGLDPADTGPIDNQERDAVRPP